MLKAFQLPTLKMARVMGSDTRKPISDWSAWFDDLTDRSDVELSQLDIAESNLMCAIWSKPPTELLPACLRKVDEWAVVVGRFTLQAFHHFHANPVRFDGSEARFRAIALIECLQRHIGLRYNFAFAEGEYDAFDPHNMFIHGLLMGFGGTCVTLPVLSCAVGRRLGYPMGLAETADHIFCRWDSPDGESFCFDAAGKGCLIRDEDYYRHWPRPITAKEEQTNALIRRMTPREELACFANLRGHCLRDRFQFGPASDSCYSARMMAPHKQCLRYDWGLSFYSTRLWEFAGKLRERRSDVPLRDAIPMVAEKLTGPDVELFRKTAVDNVLRIIRNADRRRNIPRRDAAMEELINQSTTVEFVHV